MSNMVEITHIALFQDAFLDSKDMFVKIYKIHAA